MKTLQRWISITKETPTFHNQLDEAIDHLLDKRIHPICQKHLDEKRTIFYRRKRNPKLTGNTQRQKETQRKMKHRRTTSKWVALVHSLLMNETSSDWVNISIRKRMCVLWITVDFIFSSPIDSVRETHAEIWGNYKGFVTVSLHLLFTQRKHPIVERCCLNKAHIRSESSWL